MYCYSSNLTMFPQALLLLLLLHCCHIVASSSIINTLPGFSGDLPFKLETGYVGVGNLDDIQLFYFFIESERSPKEDPLLLWLSGGPGCSSFTAMVYDSIDAWTKIANVIFLDQPVGTGYSYAKSWEEYRAGDTLSCTQTYEFLRKVKIWHSIDYHRNLTKKNLRALVYREVATQLQNTSLWNVLP